MVCPCASHVLLVRGSSKVLVVTIAVQAADVLPGSGPRSGPGGGRGHRSQLCLQGDQPFLIQPWSRCVQPDVQPDVGWLPSPRRCCRCRPCPLLAHWWGAWRVTATAACAQRTNTSTFRLPASTGPPAPRSRRCSRPAPTRASRSSRTMPTRVRAARRVLCLSFAQSVLSSAVSAPSVLFGMFSSGWASAVQSSPAALLLLLFAYAGGWKNLEFPPSRCAWCGLCGRYTPTAPVLTAPARPPPAPCSPTATGALNRGLSAAGTSATSPTSLRAAGRASRVRIL